MKDGLYYDETSIIHRKGKKSRNRTIKKFTKVQGRYSKTEIDIIDLENKKFDKSLIWKGFIVSLCLILGTYFFTGMHDSIMTRNEVQDSIVNEINGVDYEYQVNYIDYDWTYKLSQLDNLQNVFDGSAILDVANSSLMTPVMNGTINVVDTPFIYLAMTRNEMSIIDYTFEDITGSEITISYLSWNAIFSPIIFATPGATKEVNQFINKRNYKDYANLYYGIDLETNVYDKVFSYMYRFFIFMNAPLQWIYTFIYDLGVIIGFITIW